MNTPPKKPEAWASTPAPSIASTALDLDNVTELRPSTGRELLAEALLEVRAFVRRFVVLPTDHAETAVTLWIAHAHTVESFDSTPRLAFLSPEPGSGKSRALEVITTLVPSPMHAVNATPAALFRSVSDLEHRPTILFDEIDTVFGPKAKENEEVRGFLNAGHRRGAVAYRCVGEGTKQIVHPFPAFCAVALAGLNDIPDTIATRSVIVRMQRRKTSQTVLPWRSRQREPEGFELRNTLAALIAPLSDELRDAEPQMPEGVEDRPADVWEPLLAIAEAAGGEWPELARAAATSFTTGATPEPSLGVLLLRHLRELWTSEGDPKHLPGSLILERLTTLEEAPWHSLKGAPLDARRLSNLLKKYQVRSTKVRTGETTVNGYTREALWGPWESYCPELLLPLPEQRNTRNNGTESPNPSRNEALEEERVPEQIRNVPEQVLEIPSQIPLVPLVPQSAQEEAGEPLCLTCKHPLPDFELEAGHTTHAACN